VIEALWFQRIQELRSDVSTREAAGMRPIVHSRHNEAEDKEHYRPRFGLIPHDAATGTLSVMHQRAQQSEDRS
jgi:hypothetical protein